MTLSAVTSESSWLSYIFKTRWLVITGWLSTSILVPVESCVKSILEMSSMTLMI
jgi:hypothetical protein